MFGISFKELDEETPDWERKVLAERAVKWLPRILGMVSQSEHDQHVPDVRADHAAFQNLPLQAMGIHSTVVSRSQL